VGFRARLRPFLDRATRAGAEAIGVRVLPAPEPERPTLESLCTALHRLDVEIARLQVSDKRTPALFHRLQSATWAYDAVLCDLCEAVGIARPGSAPLDALARLEAEADVVAAGVAW
jgi:hypothetical protein